MKVFLSHADADKQITLPFMKLLKDGIGIRDVFCSSSKGAITNGEFFVLNILTELLAAECTISLLSHNYLKSQFCLAELGSAKVAQFDPVRRAKFNSFIIPPTKFGDLVGMLLGVQSEQVEDITALDNLCSRLGGDVASAGWIAARDAFRDAIKPFTDFRRAEELLSKIVIHDFRAEPTADPRFTYKSKIRVQFKNNTGELVEISNPRWNADAADVPLQIPPQNFDVLQIETSAGWHKDAWENEAGTILVTQGAVFRLWFGLHQSCPPDELRRRHEGQLLGKLQLQVKINGIDLVWEKRL